MSARRFWLALSCSAWVICSAPAALPLRSIEISGGTPPARRVAEQAARGWSNRTPDSSDLEDLLSAVGSSLVRQGWGGGEIEASLDSLAGGARCRMRLHGIRPTRLAGWVWDPDSAGPAIGPGAWVPERAEEELGERLRLAQEKGHPFASIQILDVQDSPAGLRVRARLQEGPALRLASTVFEGRGMTRASYLERVAGLRRGDPIRPSEAEQARERLERTGLFAEVRGPWLRPMQETTASLLYRLVPLLQNRAEGAVGYDGSRRTLSGFVHMELGNLFGTGRRMDASWERLDRDRSLLSLDYREPYLARLPLAAAISVSQQIEDTTWTSDHLAGQVEGDLGGGLTARLGVSANRTVESGPFPSRTKRVSTLAGVALDNLSQAGTNGSLLDVELSRGAVDRTPGLPEGEGTLVAIALRGEGNLHAGARGHLRGELRAGWIDGPDSLPRPDASGLGGATTLRGYPEHAFRVLRYALLRCEIGLRILPEGNRVYAFTDGAVFRPWPKGPALRRTGYGVGVRVRGAGGWVRLDYGVPSGETPLSGRIHFRLETRF